MHHGPTGFKSEFDSGDILQFGAGRDNFQDVLQVAAKKIAKHNLHAVLMVPGEDFEDAIEAAPSEWKEKVNYYSGEMHLIAKVNNNHEAMTA